MTVCDFCLEEVKTVGEDSIYWCDEHGVVEAYTHEESEDEDDN